MKPIPAIAIFLTTVAAHGATLSAVAPTATQVSSVDLTAAGTTNWAAWNNQSGTAVASDAADFTKTGGIGTISAVVSTNSAVIPADPGPPAIPQIANTVRGTGSLVTYPDNVFTWSDGAGTPPAQMAGVFHTTLNQTQQGVQFTISNLPALAGGLSYLVTVYGSSFEGTSQVTATLGANIASVTGNAKGTGDDAKTTDVYQFSYNPDGTADSLILSNQLIVDSTAAGSSHSLIQAVTISVIPEASMGVLALLGGLLTLNIRRRR